MGQLAFAAKITHVPSMYISEMDGPHKGCRQAAIDGHKEISRRCRELGVDTIVVFDTHWLVNSGYHINCAPHFQGVYTSNELPHFIKNMPYEYDGNPELGRLLAKYGYEAGVNVRAHDATSLEMEYGTLVPMRYMNADRHFKVVSVSALCTVHSLDDSARMGAAMRRAVEEEYDGTVAFFASGSLSHRFAQNGVAEDYLFKVWSPFLEEMDHRVIQMWEDGTTRPSSVDPSYQELDTPGRYVLLTNKDLIGLYSGVAGRDGVPVGIRMSTVAYDFDGETLDFSGVFGPGGQITAAVVVPSDLPTNPFLHRYHPDHNNLDEHFLNYEEEAFQVVRNMQLVFTADDPTGASPPGWGDSIMGGTFAETITGLHRNPIFTSGTFRLTRASAVTVLNQ